MRKPRVMEYIAIVMVALIAACSSIPLEFGWDKPGECNVYEKVGATPENSLIAKRIANPCQAQKVIGTLTKVAVVWSEVNVDDFNAWATKVEEYIAAGFTYYDLQQWLTMEIAKLNLKAGVTLLIVSDLLVQFPDKTPVMEKDQTLMLMSVTDLKQQVAKLALLYKSTAREGWVPYGGRA